MKWLVSFLFAVQLMAQIAVEDVFGPEDTGNASDAGAAELPENHDHGSGPAEQAKPDVLHFLNGDVLSGELLAVDPEAGLSLAHASVTDPIQFALTDLKALQVTGRFPEDQLAGLSRITLTNGDQLLGEILEMNGGGLKLQTPYAGEVSIQTRMIRSMSPTSASKAIYKGPEKEDEWTTKSNRSNGSWTFKKRAFYSEGHGKLLGKDFEDLPEKTEIAFDLAWRGNPQINICLWAASDGNPHQDVYNLSMQGSYVQCYRNSNHAGHQDLGSTNEQRFQKQKNGRFQIFLNRKSKEITLYLDGRMVKKWVDTFEGKINGDALIFYSNGSEAMKLSAIVVQEWDGEFPSNEDEVEAGDKDLLELSNGDVFSGKIHQIAEGSMRFENDFATFEIPVKKISSTVFTPDNREVQRKQAGDVQFCFPGGEKVTLELISLADGKLRGRSQSLGELEMDLAFMENLILNPYDERQVDEEDDW